MTRKDFYITSLSALVQYYEYHLFGFLAAAISKNFFFESDPSIRLLKTYLIMFIGVCAKPIGALLLGRIGDIYGRQRAINIAIIITAAASFVIGVLPSYSMIGMASTFILLLMRMFITSCSSSGTDGVRVYIYEKMSNKNKNLASGIAAIMTMLGSFLASLSAWFFTLSDFPDYYWRFAFVLGSVAGLLVTLVRNYGRLNQESELKQENQYEQYRKMSVIEIVKQNLKLLTFCIIVAGGIGTAHGFNLVFLVNFNFEILQNIDKSSMQYYRSCAIVLYMIFAIVSGWIADTTSARATSFIATIFIILFSILNCYMLNQNILSIPIYLTVSALVPFVTIPALTLLQSSIPKVIRYRLFSLSHSIGAIIISAPSAGICTVLYEKTKIAWLPNVYFIFVMLVMLAAMNLLFNLKNTSQKYNPQAE